jgi:hypothetical protein
MAFIIFLLLVDMFAYFYLMSTAQNVNHMIDVSIGCAIVFILLFVIGIYIGNAPSRREAKLLLEQEREQELELERKRREEEQEREYKRVKEELERLRKLERERELKRRKEENERELSRARSHPLSVSGVKGDIERENRAYEEKQRIEQLKAEKYRKEGLAMMHEELFTWHYREFVYKEIYGIVRRMVEQGEVDGDVLLRNLIPIESWTNVFRSFKKVFRDPARITYDPMYIRAMDELVTWLVREITTDGVELINVFSSNSFSGSRNFSLFRVIHIKLRMEREEKVIDEDDDLPF